MQPSEGPEEYELAGRVYHVAAVEPLDVDGVRTLQVGTALWALAFLVLLPFWSRLSAAGHLWWLWTCAAGTVGGLLGLCHCVRRRNARRRTSDQPVR